MIRYWFEFDFEEYTSVPPGTRIGCGVTSFDYEDALNILRQKVFNNNVLAPIIHLVENVNVSTLDASHVLPNIGLPNLRGVWFPLGYD